MNKKTLNPDHKEHLIRLNKIEGQVKGIKKMVEDGRYCIDILTQTKAVKAAIKKLEQEILKGHIQHCIKAAVNSGEPNEISEKINEIVDLLDAQ